MSADYFRVLPDYSLFTLIMFQRFSLRMSAVSANSDPPHCLLQFIKGEDFDNPFFRLINSVDLVVSVSLSFSLSFSLPINVLFSPIRDSYPLWKKMWYGHWRLTVLQASGKSVLLEWKFNFYISYPGFIPLILKNTFLTYTYCVFQRIGFPIRLASFFQDSSKSETEKDNVLLFL